MNYCVTHNQFYTAHCVYCGPPKPQTSTAAGKLDHDFLKCQDVADYIWPSKVRCMYLIGHRGPHRDAKGYEWGNLL